MLVEKIESRLAKLLSCVPARLSVVSNFPKILRKVLDAFSLPLGFNIASLEHLTLIILFFASR